MHIDWDRLRAAAASVANHAYVPYSKLHVGAAAFTSDGRLVTGCNVENASYGLTLCAECGLVSALVASGGGRLVAVSTVAAPAEHLERMGHIAPCGRCRQLLMEHGGPDLLVDGPDGPVRLSALLPEAFMPTDLPQ